MSCCPTAPEIKVGSSGDEDVAAQDTEIRPGESVECYMRRSGNTTGRMDDKTGAIPGKIENTDVPLNKGYIVNVTFRLTKNSEPDADGWSISGTPLPDGVTFVDNGTTATMKGEFPSSSFGQQFKIQVEAIGIDKRGFVFSPQKANGSNEIVFVHPLPGAHVSSPFGPRIPPTTGASSKHAGADFSLKPNPPGDVLAAADGEVTFTGFQAGGAGNYVKIKHANAAGKELCTTVYMHLATIYVSTGQQVVAGQKIGKEGNTGIGTGPHLHFECRLPNGTTIDPVPLIRGTVGVARLTNDDNTAVEDSIEPSTANGALTPENVDAKEAGCEPFGPDYPKDPSETDEPAPDEPAAGSPPLADPFESAWFFTMTHEVGPGWTKDAPNDPEVAQGLIETKPQRQKDGYVNTANFPGGETKFGIAQGPNPSINVNKINYADAKKTGFNNYWKRGPADLVTSKPRTAVMLFDLNYLHGVGNANTIKSKAGIADIADDLEAATALSKAQQDFMKTIAAGSETKKKYLTGWLKRSSDLLSYVKGLS